MARFRRLLVSCFVAGAIAAIPVTGDAWTRPGHMVTAAIAYDDLEASSPEVIDRVARILEAHPDRGPFEVAEDRTIGRERVRRLIMECARWPDDARLTLYDHPTWHTELSPVVRRQDPPPTAPDSAVVMDGEQAFALNARVMANPKASPSDRAVALCWVMHLTGDVHQPLHTAQLFSTAFPDGDAAGSLQFVLDPDTGQPITLHWFWDDSVHQSGEPSSVSARARALERAAPRTSLTELGRPGRAADYAAWARESHDLAVSVAYRDGVVGGMTASTARRLPDAYVRATRQVAERRAAVAGYRLADLLREAFSTDTRKRDESAG